MTIRAFAAKGAKQPLEPFEFDPGPLGADEVEVKIEYCGVCHSDLAMIDNDWGFTAYPLVAGHEVVGTVTAVGSTADPDLMGKRVGVGWQSSACLRCEWCGRGKEHFCAKERDTIIGRPGGFADAVRVQWKFAVPLPAGLDLASAGPLMCAGTTVFTPILHHGVTAGTRAAVLGVGGLGHLAVQFLAKFGCEVTAISSSHSKDDEARKLGATRVIATRNADELKKAAGSFDFIISTVAADVDWPAFIAALRPEGKLVICGIPESDLKFPAFPMLNEKSVHGGRSGSPADTAEMLAFAARTGVKPWVEAFPMREVNRALDHVRSGKARYRAVLAA
jgi:uncharacterized zinc-type alcohol dehydrogenase-like protein